MPQYQRRHVADRPELRLGIGKLDPVHHQRAERVAGMQRAMASAPDVSLAAPVDELVPWRGREQHLAGGRAEKRRPDPRQRIGVVGRAKASLGDRRVEGRELPVDAPGCPAIVKQRAAGCEAELAVTGAQDHALPGAFMGVALEPDDQVDPGDSPGDAR